MFSSFLVYITLVEPMIRSIKLYLRKESVILFIYSCGVLIMNGKKNAY
jgi:hypothetical protein